jgi:glycerol kinase
VKYLLALDQGTTSSRAMLFDLAGKPLGSVQRQLTQHFPQPGWVEHDPVEIWESQLGTARDLLSQTRTAPADIAAVGITNQRETTVVWDRASGAPVYPAIVWQDRRTVELCRELAARGLAKKFNEKTGLPLDPYFSGTKLAWILRNVPDVARRAESGELAFGTVDSWLIYNLTGGKAHLTDVTNASRTLLFDIHALEWNEELLSALEIPAALLPEVRPSAGYFARTDPRFFGEALTVSGVAGDQHAALFGQACFTPGMAKNTYGTGAFVMMNSGESAAGGAGCITTLAWQIEGRPAEYALEGSIFVAGAAVQWLRDGLGIIASSADIEGLAASVPDAGGVYFVPALTGLGAPHWDPSARGTIVGLTRGTTKAHLARATLEAVAYQTRDAIAAMESASGLKLRELRVDGGASANGLLMQLQADVLDVPVIRAQVMETTALGAAYLAGIGAGALDQASVQQRWLAGARFEPNAAEVASRELGYSEWRRAVGRARNWIES